MATNDQVREAVREKYAASALQVLQSRPSGGACCGGGCACSEPSSTESHEWGTSNYRLDDLSAIPEAAAQASLGCGNPTALIDLREGETVLDLGSGGGIDVLLSARRVGPGGKAIGLDMTDEMLELARRNAAQAGATNVEFLKGTIEDIPLPDASVDVVISNCVINLSPDKGQVLQEVGRVLRPGGRFAVSDVVVLGSGFGENVRQHLALWAGCIAGAMSEQEYREKLAAARLDDVSIEVTREHGAVPEELGSGEQRIVSAFVRATKRA